MSTTASTISDEDWGRFDRRAANVLLLLSVILFLLGLVVLGGTANATIDPPWIEAMFGRSTVLVAVLIAVILNVGILYALSAGLNRGAGWARPAAVSVLVVMTVTGLLQVAVDLLFNSRLTIPIGALLAMWALSLRPGWPAWPGGRDGMIAAALTVAVAAVSLPGVLPWGFLGG